jgi:hypothetical protein
MNLHNETASPARLTGSVVSKAVAAKDYLNASDTATYDYAAAVVASRFRLTISTAHLVCHLSGIGGAK